MSSKVKPIPEGHHTVTPYLMIKGAARAIDYYERAFGAEAMMCMADPEGKVRHAEIRIGDSRLMISDEFPEEFPQFRSAESMGGSPMNIYLYVDDVDALCRRAIAAGGLEIEPVADQFYGDRRGGVRDPFGYVWWIATHKEDLSVEVIRRRATAAGRA
jgi:PhnB protein